jgi:chromosome partitioning protein
MTQLKRVVVTGICGGVGSTTVTAELAHHLLVSDKAALLLDFSPQNALRLHFGMAWSNRHGLAPQILAGRPWSEAAFQCENGVLFVPFGHCDHADLPRFYERLPRNWLEARLDELDVGDERLILIDCPTSNNALYDESHALADLIVVVLDTDTLSYAALAESQIGIAPEYAEKTIFVVNKFDPSREIDRDVLQLLRLDIGAMLCPVMIHRDESVREAFACQLSVGQYEPASQAATDFAALSTWLVAKLTHLQREVA